MFFRFPIFVFIFAVCWGLTAGIPSAAAADAAKCGSDGQPPCAYAKAKFVGKACDGKDEFWDPINGGTCWSCPSSHPNRTANPVDGSAACSSPAIKTAKAKFVTSTSCGKGQFRDPRKGGECWSCPDGYNRTASAVTAKDACIRPAYTSHHDADHKRYTILATSCHKGEFWDAYNYKKKGAGCWTCSDGYNRTAEHITSSKACSKHHKAKPDEAKYHHKEGATRCEKSKDEFYDPRKGGECWSCPKDYNRSASPVDRDDSCTKGDKVTTSQANTPKMACDLNNNEVWDPRNKGECWSCPKGMGRSLEKVTSDRACAMPVTAQAVKAIKGETVGCEKGLIEFDNKCYVPGACGKKDGDRACAATEHIPSCDKGLRESRAKCVKLKPGEIGFLSTLGEYSADLAQEAKDQCQETLDLLPVIKFTGMPMRDTTEIKYFSIGFSCAITGELDKFSALADKYDGYRQVAVDADKASREKPCAEWKNPWRPVCSLTTALVDRSVAQQECALGTITSLKIGEAKPQPKKELWIGRGELAYEIYQLVKSLGDEKEDDKADSGKEPGMIDKVKAKAGAMKEKWDESKLGKFMAYIDKLNTFLGAAGLAVVSAENAMNKDVSKACVKAF